jgi:uncharacterized membrane protein
MRDVLDQDFASPDRNVEDELIGKWFPRVGALAVVVGAGFGFRYAVDQGWIGLRLRVMLGILLASVLIAIGDWTKKRGWPVYAAAITGGGIGLMYLTLWAAVGVYGLLSASAGFLCLIGVSGLGCALAVRHESQTLALLSIIGGFVNPFITGASAEMPHGLYLYILSIDLAVVALSFLRPWNLLEKVAFISSWIVLEVGAGTPRLSMIAATGIFLMFGVLPYARVLLGRDQGTTDLAMVPINGLLYYFAIFARSTGDFEPYRGLVTLGLAAFFLIGTLVIRGRDRDEYVETTSAALAFFFITMWVPVQLGVELIPFGWAIEAVVLLSLAVVHDDERLRIGGWIILVMAGMTELFVVADGPESVLHENYGRFVMIALVAALYIGAYLEHRSQERHTRDLALVAANVVTLGWLSLEVYAAVWYNVVNPRIEDLHFGLSGVWALYAALLLGVGIYFRARGARLMSLVLFGITIVKMALHDLWLLDTLQRLIGFTGIGAILLVCSLTYHRFRYWVMGENAGGV